MCMLCYNGYMIRRFSQITGRTAVPVSGQTRIAYTVSDSSDLFDLAEWEEHGGYQGSVITFLDTESGEAYTPFEKRRNVMYGVPVYEDGAVWFLQADAEKRTVTLYRYVTGQTPEEITALDMDTVDLYNLQVMGSPVHIISQRDRFTCYWPEQFSFALRPEETAVYMEDGRILVEAWTEEGWDTANGRASDTYRFYSRVIIKDQTGITLSEETGSLYRTPEGVWWIS